MADDRHYVPGDFYRICDRTGFKIRAVRTAKEWTGHIVRAESWEPRQPQDFVRGVTDDQTVPDPRPRQVDFSQGPFQTTIGRAAPAGSSVINFSSTVQIQIGDIIGIMLDDGTVFRVAVTALGEGFSSGFSTGFAAGVSIAKPLPYSAAAGNLVTDYGTTGLFTIGRSSIGGPDAIA